MAKILQLLSREKHVSQHATPNNEALCNALQEKILKSFRVIEHEALPLLDEMNRSIQHIFSEKTFEQPSADQMAALKKAGDMANQLHALVQCYQHMFVPSARP